MVTSFVKLKKLKIFQSSILMLALLFAFIGFAQPVKAGFGISPPYLKNQQLVPGSRYEQQITLLRSSAEEDLKATVTINAPQVASWISLDKGNEFILSKGQVQVPMMVTVNVPKDAELGNYKGSINIKITSAGPAGAGVAIALGARVDIDLTLTNVAYSDFVVKVASIPDFETLGWPWKYKIFSPFLYRAKVLMNIENIGNTPTAPTKVALELYDITKTKLLETSEDTSIDKIDSFSTKEVAAYFPTKLNPGQYWGKVKVYKGNTITNVYEIAFTIAKNGEMPGGGQSLGYLPWLLLVGYIFGLVVVLYVLIRIKIWRYLARLLLLLLGLLAMPLKPIVRKLAELWTNMKLGFWRWIGRKASRYDDRDRRDR